jgi:uncharacterized protein (DUF1501 family)
MNRRNFLRRTATAGIPLLSGLTGLHAASGNRLNQLLSAAAEGKVLVLIQLTGGNDGLNTLVPLDQYDNLRQVRPNLIIPERSLLPLQNGSSRAFHPRMGGIRDLYRNNQLSIVQSVGYPNQNRSHFRSTDIWSTASPAEVQYTTGWTGRYLESENENYPVGYPNPDRPHPLAITMGNAASETCQGTVTNLCQTVNDPESVTYLSPGGATPLPDMRAAEEIDFLRVAISQTNLYGAVIEEAASSGRTSATYPDTRFGDQLRDVVRLIDGGLETKVYVVQLGGFDTHASQVGSSTTEGDHADLLGELSAGLSALQQDLDELKLNERVLGMTFSEFGRRIRSNSSQGSDHGDAAPLFVFGSCASGTVLGDDPEIDPEVEQGDGVPMQYDFRDVYGSVLTDWFEVSESQVRTLLYPDFQYLPVANACSAVALPVELLSFVATGKDRAIELDWQTADERDNRGFEIERSTDGRAFTFIGFVTAAADPGGGAFYLYVDPEVSINQLYYYRLRQVDLDGTITTGPVVTARLSGSSVSDWAVGLPFPNPAEAYTNLSIHAPHDATVRISVVDAGGRQLLTDTHVVIGRRDNALRIPTDRLPAGLYSIQVTTGQRRQVRKLVVR